MQKIKLGKSDLEISRIVFGAWAIGGSAWGGNDERDSLAALEAAYDNGISSFDTAPIYGYGLSEELLGKAVQNIGRDKVEILTKFGINWKTTKGEFYFEGELDGKKIDVFRYSGKDGIIQELEDSLRRLKTDYIDLYQVHRPDNSTPIEETMGVLMDLKKEGKIREIAVSNYDLNQTKEAVKYADIVSNQMPYSMLLRGIEKDVLPFTIESNIGILAYSPLQRGVLSGKYKGEIHWKEDDHRKDAKWFQKENLARINAYLDKLRPIAEDHKISLSQLVLAWTLAQNGISAILAGARNAEQVKSNAAASHISLSEDELNFIKGHLDNLKI